MYPPVKGSFDLQVESPPTLEAGVKCNFEITYIHFNLSFNFKCQGLYLSLAVHFQHLSALDIVDVYIFLGVIK